MTVKRKRKCFGNSTYSIVREANVKYSENNTEKKIELQMADSLEDFNKKTDVNMEKSVIEEMETNRDDDWRDGKRASQCLEHLYLSEHLADVTFTFASHPTERLPAHKFALSMRSKVFEAMFYGSMAESGDTIRLDDIEPEIMKLLLRYVYTDEPRLEGSTVLHCLYAAKKYNLGGLVKLCSHYLENNIDLSNVCTLHEQAIFFEMKELQKKCFDFILENAQNVFSTSDFEHLSLNTLQGLLSSNDLTITEEEIFKHVLRWAAFHCTVDGLEASAENMRKELGEAIYQIRFSWMDIADFAKIVPPAGILTSEEQLMLYQYLATKGTTPLDKFNKEARIGKVHEIDTSQFYQTSPIVGKECILQFKGFSPDTYFGMLNGSGQRREVSSSYTCTRENESALKLVSLTGKFVPFVDKVLDKSSNDTPIPFSKFENMIYFTPPLGQLDGRIMMFVFKTDCLVKRRTRNVDQTIIVNGKRATLARIPYELNSLSFR